MPNDIHNARPGRSIRADLFFGMGAPSDANHVKGDVFRDWASDALAPFKDGYTLIPCLGGWNGKIESVFVLCVYAPDTDGFRALIRQTAERYKTAFAQEAVLYSFTETEFTVNVWPHGPVGAYHREGSY